MNRQTCEAIVRDDADFASGQFLLAKLMRLNALSAPEQQVIEDIYWAALAAAFKMGYDMRPQ